jgi:hypothetical protein
MNYLVPQERIQSMREVVYSILTSANDQKAPDVALAQTNAVTLTNAVKKDGVTIINNQSVVVANITLAAVDMLRELDGLPLAVQEAQEAQEVQAEGGPYNGATAFLEECLHKRLSLREVAAKISDLYTRFVSDFNDGDEEETRKMLGVRKTRMLSL